MIQLKDLDPRNFLLLSNKFLDVFLNIKKVSNYMLVFILGIANNIFLALVNLHIYIWLGWFYIKSTKSSTKCILLDENYISHNHISEAIRLSTNHKKWQDFFRTTLFLSYYNYHIHTGQNYISLPIFWI